MFRIYENMNFYTSLMGLQIGTIVLEDNWAIPIKIKVANTVSYIRCFKKQFFNDKNGYIFCDTNMSIC